MKNMADCACRALGLFGLVMVLGVSLARAEDTPVEEGLAAADAAPAAAKRELDRADNAWMLTSSALVLFMTVPGLAMFYGGLVRKKNVVSVLMQCIFLMGLMTVIW